MLIYSSRLFHKDAGDLVFIVHVNNRYQIDHVLIELSLVSVYMHAELPKSAKNGAE